MVGPRLHWATDINATSIGYGFSVHDRKSRQAFADAGGVLDPDAPVAVQTASVQSVPDPIPGRFNVLNTAWESTVIPPCFARRIARFDAVIVNSTFLVDVFQQHFPTKPVFLCHLGVDTDTFTYKRRIVGVPFRFLWCGAATDRKGYKQLLDAWGLAQEILARPSSLPGHPGPVRRSRGPAIPTLHRAPPIELYMKTTKVGDAGSVKRQVSSRGTVTNIVIDTRDLPAAELAAVYHRSHAFLFPTWGEGFGLTLAEAMATGLPCAYTAWSGHMDFAGPATGYPLKYFPDAATNFDPEGKVVCPLARPDVQDLAITIVAMWKANYSDALKKGAAAAQVIRDGFTWDRTGRRLVEIAEACAEHRSARGRPYREWVWCTRREAVA